MTNQITYQTLSEENAHLVQTADVFDNPVDPEQLDAFLANPAYHMVIALVGGQVIGMASAVVMRHPDKQPLMFVNEVGVNDPFRKRGIGEQLTQMLINWGRETGCKGIWLATETDNIAARALYRKLGARETEDVVVYDWDDAL